MVAALLLGLGGAVAAAPDLPLRYFNPVLDGKPAVAGDPTDGTTWAAWAYRAQGEFDLAISSRDASGTWAAPRFLGEGDRLDQVDPALVADGTGNLYLAFAVRPLGRVYLAVRPAGSSEFSNPVEASLPGERASSPQLRIVRDRLVLGYRVGTRVVLRDLPLLGMGTHGVQDGPDILPPLGNTTTPGTGGGGGGGSRSPGSSPAPGS
jgi:hypothetical protein